MAFFLNEDPTQMSNRWCWGGTVIVQSWKPHAHKRWQKTKWTGEVGSERQLEVSKQKEIPKEGSLAPTGNMRVEEEISLTTEEVKTLWKVNILLKRTKWQGLGSNGTS